MNKKEEGKHRSEYYSKQYEHYMVIGYTNGESSKLAHRDLAKEFKQKNLCLKHRLSVEDIFRNTGVKPNDIRGWLSGKRKIPDWITEESLTKTND